MRTPRLAILLAVPLAVVVAVAMLAQPSPSKASLISMQPAGPGAREITVTMTDGMRFEPAEIRVGVDEPIRLHVVNAGVLRHELVAGTTAELDEHARVMADLGPNHDAPGAAEHAHSDVAISITLTGGGEGAVEFRATAAGILEIGCFEVGHYEAGMRGSLVIE